MYHRICQNVYLFSCYFYKSDVTTSNMLSFIPLCNYDVDKNNSLGRWNKNGEDSAYNL